MNNTQHFRRLLDTVPQIIWTAEPDGTVDYANAALTSYTGIPISTSLQDNWITAIHPEDLQRCIEAWQFAIETGGDYLIEFRIIRQSDQSYRWHLVHAKPIRDEAGRIIKWYGAATDIHDRKLMEQDMQHLARRLTTTLESITDAFVALDADWRFIYVNHEAEHMTRRTSTDLLGKVIWTEFPQLKSDGIGKCLLQTRTEQRTVEIDAFSPDLQKWFGVRAYPSDGGVTVYFRDITDYKLAQDAIRQSQQKFEIIAKATSDAIWDWDLSTNKVWRNTEFQALIKVGNGGIPNISEIWIDHIHPDDRERVLSGIYAAINNSAVDSWTDEYRFVRNDGSSAFIVDRGFIIRDETGKAVRMVGGMTDITARKKAEENVARVNRALRMLSESNKALIHATSESALLQEICKIAVNVGGYRMAWVGYAENDEVKSIVPMAYAGRLNDPDFISNIKISWSEQHPRGQGPGGQTIRTATVKICPDVTKEPVFSAWGQMVMRNGFRGLISLPLCEDGRAFGLLALYSVEPLQVNDEEIGLLQDLANNLAFGITNLESQKRRQLMESAVLKVAAGVSTRAGAEFFEQLARSMADALGGQAGFIAKFLPGQPLIAQTISAIIDGETVDNFEYAIDGTPCERFRQDNFCVVQQNVSSLFPNSYRLGEFNAQAYVGHRLDDSNGKPLGLIYVLFRQPLKNVDLITSTLKIFAARAAAELERYEADVRIRDQASLLNKTRDAIVVCDLDHRILFWNNGAERLYGWSANEAIGKIKTELLYDDLARSNRATEAVLKQGEWRGQFTYRRKDGSEVPVDAHWSLVRDDDGQPQSIFTVYTDITQRKADERAIQQLAFYDTLTGLPNRRLLLDRLEKALTNVSRNHNTGALLFIDLDNFKSLNDTVGHDKGDLLLQQVANRLQSCIRKNNTVARFGGDEFVIVLEDLDKDLIHAAAQVESVAEKVLASFSIGFDLAGVEHHSTPSIGVTLFSDGVDSIDELLKRADLAMYQAKAAGRNAIRFFDPEMQKIISARVALESDMRDALRQSRFSLHYQSQTDSDGQLTGTEALVRWKHPVRGYIPPAEFIPLAEESGLIMPIGEWVLESACAQLAKWASSPFTTHLSIAVNVSARQFRHPDFVQQVQRALERYGANPHRLKLEITESVLIEDLKGTVSKMNALKTHGVSFSLDDFGTGYSSLSYLKQLPLDQIKIDQSFVNDILNDPNDAAIAKTIVALGQSLGLKVIAEGVETVEQRDFLAEYGCNAYQGFLYGHPLPIDQFENLMRNNDSGHGGQVARLMPAAH